VLVCTCPALIPLELGGVTRRGRFHAENALKLLLLAVIADHQIHEIDGLSLKSGTG
jgi:hypothetical protein